MSEDKSWDDRLLPLLTADWQGTDALAKRLNAKPFTVLARLKDLMRRNLVQRRLVDKGPGKGSRQRITSAEFRRTVL